jgi:hypothetical protein
MDNSVPIAQAQTVFDNANEPKYLWINKGSHLSTLQDYIKLFNKYFIQKIINYSRTSLHQQN